MQKVVACKDNVFSRNSQHFFQNQQNRNHLAEGGKWYNKHKGICLLIHCQAAT
ncbi:MAG: hypothetical protein II502_04355 [Paludibacteraceae bacterium]|nr:hypothetical protein [Paludibacteraceae bacterium]